MNDTTLLNSLGLTLLAMVSLLLGRAQMVRVTVPARRMQQRRQDKA